MSQRPANARNLREQAKPLFLASVTSVSEADAAKTGGADIIDCKNPAEGALGALPVEVVAAIRSAIAPSVKVSATIGDLVPEPDALVAAATAMAATGVDYVKIGFFPGGDAKAAIRALGRAFGSAQPVGSRGRLIPGAPGAATPAAPQHLPARSSTDGPSQPRIVGLLLADRGPDFSLIADMAAAGFAGVMLDTADKQAGALPKVMPMFRLAVFVKEAHRVGLFAGLAGSLRKEHISQLIGLEPDILGFRGALCRAHDRVGVLDPFAVADVHRALRSHRMNTSGATRQEANRA